jgi:hypothetical protein
LTFPDGEVAEVAWVPLDDLPDWISDHQLCPDSLALAADALRSLAGMGRLADLADDGAPRPDHGEGGR